LEHHHAAAIDSVGEEIYRIWRLYMAASAYGFASGRLAIDQVLLAKRRANGSSVVPLSRADIYSSPV
jgi:cyclopropane-fatty-acyl-phospholipid synthase